MCKFLMGLVCSTKCRVVFVLVGVCNALFFTTTKREKKIKKERCCELDSRHAKSKLIHKKLVGPEKLRDQ